MFHLPTRHPPNCGLPPTPRAIPAATQMPRLAFRHRIPGVLIPKPPYHRTPLIKTRQNPFALVNPQKPLPAPSLLPLPYPKGTRAGLYGGGVRKGKGGSLRGEWENRGGTQTNQKLEPQYSKFIPENQKLEPSHTKFSHSQPSCPPPSMPFPSPNFVHPLLVPRGTSCPFPSRSPLQVSLSRSPSPGLPLLTLPLSSPVDNPLSPISFPSPTSLPKSSQIQTWF